MLQPKMSEVLRLQELILKHGQESPEAWLGMCSLLADASDNPAHTVDYWDRHPTEVMDAMQEVEEKTMRGLISEEEWAKLKAEETEGNPPSSAPSK